MFGKKKEKDLIASGVVIEGLQLVDPSVVIKMQGDQLVFDAYIDKHIYNLPLDRISRMQICPETEYKTVRPSLIKSIAGGAMFGVPGAIVGAAPKEKKTLYYVLAIVYDKGMISVKSVEYSRMEKLVKKFNELHPENMQPSVTNL